ncbi:hypothetical protein [Actinoplanes sp. NPDC049316]|uniref:hypothetical protein n=1 Tax=Actinoplanes sp. NPDC049316 TaxID=3154727 RepID=UPI00342B7421
MRLSLRDAVAALMMGVILTPYATLLVRGRAPYVANVATMAALSLAVAAGVFVVAGGITVRTLIGRVEIGFAGAALVLGVVTIVLGDTPLGQLLLGAFITMVLLTWGTQLLDHAGYMQPPHRPS